MQPTQCGHILIATQDKLSTFFIGSLPTGGEQLHHLQQQTMLNKCHTYLCNTTTYSTGTCVLYIITLTNEVQ